MTGNSIKLQVTLVRKFVDKFLYYAFKSFGHDYKSLKKINHRKDLQEIGAKNAGWVVSVSLIDSSSIVYCVGCGEDISFDIALIDQFDCDVFAFDPTPKAVKHVEEVAGRNSKYHFQEIGLWEKKDEIKFYTPKNPKHVSHSFLNIQKTEDYIIVHVNRLKNIMQEMGHTKIDLLKLDIEGAEYKVISTIIEDNIDIKMICVEYDECFHPLDDDYVLRIRASVSSLLAKGYTLVCAQYGGNYTFVKDT